MKMIELFGALWAFVLAGLNRIPWRRKAVKPTGAESKTYVVNDYHFPGNVPNPDRRNKKYADQKQKAKHNRRRKPKKAMRRLYQLGRNKAHPMARRS